MTDRKLERELKKLLNYCINTYLDSFNSLIKMPHTVLKSIELIYNKNKISYIYEFSYKERSFNIDVRFTAKDEIYCQWVEDSNWELVENDYKYLSFLIAKYGLHIQN